MLLISNKDSVLAANNVRTGIEIEKANKFCFIKFFIVIRIAVNGLTMKCSRKQCRLNLALKVIKPKPNVDCGYIL